MYVPDTLTERWYASSPLCKPEIPTVDPLWTRPPRLTTTRSRYEYEVTTPPPWSIDTVVFATTLPANRTTPEPTEVTREPDGAATSIPQCPAHRPRGANDRMISESEGIPNPKHDDTSWDVPSSRAARTRSMVTRHHRRHHQPYRVRLMSPRGLCPGGTGSANPKTEDSPTKLV